MRVTLLALAACGGTPTDAVSAGSVEGTDAVVGLAASADAGRLYVCGGPDSMGTLNRWFDVAIDDDLLTGASDGWTVTAERDGDWVGEIVDPDGGAFAFALSPGEGADGPYEAEAVVGRCPAGAVVLGGALQGVACPEAEALPAQVVPVGVIGRAPGPIEVRTEGEPPLEFVVVPVEP